MRLLLLSFLLLALTTSSAAQPHAADDLIRSLRGAEAKFVALADAMPEEAWTWRPAEGVRSSSEVLRHVAGANYLFPMFIGVAPPEATGLSFGPEGPVGVAEYESVTDRTETRASLDASFAHLVGVLEGMSESDLASEIEAFGQTMSVREFAMSASAHMHEHLGQLVAYARVNGVVPPWSAAAAGN